MRSKLVILMMLSVLTCDGFAKHRRSVSSIPLMFPPSRAALIAQNQVVNELGLVRVQDDKHLKSLVESEELVAIQETEQVRVAPSLPYNRRYVRPWVNQFLAEMGAAYFNEFGVPLQVNSAVRTVHVQNRLRRILGRTAAPSTGDTASSHLAGLTVDLKRSGLTRAQLKWTQVYLYNVGYQIIVEEERRCFHVMVRPVKESCPKGYPTEISCIKDCQCS